MLWGLWVSNPFWSVFGSAQLFSALGLVAPEVFWGCLAIFCGVITTYGALRRSYASLLLGSSIAWAHWLMIAIFYFIGDWQNTGGITALSIAVYASFIYLNLKVSHGKNRKDITDILR